MIELIFALFLMFSFLLVVWFWYLYRRFLKFKAEIVEFVTSPDEKTPSKFAILVDTMSARAGYAIAMQIKTSLMGKTSGVSKAENAVEQAIVEDNVASHNPLAGALLSSFPRLGRLIKRHPEYIDLAMPFLNNVAQSRGNGGAVSASQPKFKL